MTEKMVFKFLFSVRVFLETYGWFILIGGGILYFLWQKYKNQLKSASPINNEADWEHKKFGEF